MEKKILFKKQKGASLVAQTVKNLLTMQATWVPFLGWEDPLEKGMATHSSTLAWKIPWTEEPGRLQSMGSQRVRHDWATSLSLFTFMHWRRKWQPIPVFLPGESHRQRSLEGYSTWGCKESDMTEATEHTHISKFYKCNSNPNWMIGDKYNLGIYMYIYNHIYI